jgi:F-type H+-transporting ATPase subunit delta
MKQRQLAMRYARALLAALPDEASVERADGFLAWLADALAASPDLRDVALNPAVPRDDRKAVFRSLADALGAPGEVKNFLSVVVDHRRSGALPAIAGEFHFLKDEVSGVVPATLTSAIAVPRDLEDRARAALEKLSGRRVRLTCEVEPGLVGGAVARIGSTIWDGSLKNQLAAVRRRMVAEE